MNSIRHESVALLVWRSWRRERNILIAALLLFGVFSLTADNFLTTDNLLLIGTLMALWTIAGVGETFIIVSGEIDFSIGSLFGFLVMVMGVLVGNSEFPVREQGVYFAGLEWNVWLAAAVVIGIGLVVGLLNGFLVTKMRLPSFVVTLAGWVGWQSGMRVITGLQPVFFESLSPVFTGITQGKLFGKIPMLSVWMVLAVIAGHLLLTRTKFGYHVQATGDNPEAAKKTGIKTDRVKIACFMLMGGLVALVTVLWVGYLTAAPMLTGIAFELQVIVAVIIGGTVLGGGRGSIVGTLLGAAVFGMIFNGVVLLRWQSAWQWIANGVIILAVVTIDSIGGRQPKFVAFLRRRKQ